MYPMHDVEIYSCKVLMLYGIIQVEGRRWYANPKAIIDIENQRGVANRPMSRLNGIIRKFNDIQKKKDKEEKGNMEGQMKNNWQSYQLKPS